MIFGKELSQAEVTALYNSDSGTETLGTVYPSMITDDALDTGWRFVAMTYEGQNDSGDSAMDECVLGFPSCEENASCPLHDEWAKSKDLIKRMLENTALDLLTEELSAKLSSKASPQ